MKAKGNPVCLFDPEAKGNPVCPRKGNPVCPNTSDHGAKVHRINPVLSRCQGGHVAKGALEEVEHFTNGTSTPSTERLHIGSDIFSAVARCAHCSLHQRRNALFPPY